MLLRHREEPVIDHNLDKNAYMIDTLFRHSIVNAIAIKKLQEAVSAHIFDGDNLSQIIMSSVKIACWRLNPEM